VFYGTSTQDTSICANLPGGLLALAFEDSQRGTYKNIQLHATQWTLHMQRQTTGMPYLLKDKQYIQQITRSRMGKKCKPACNTFSINCSYIGAFITYKPDPTPCTVIYSLGVVACRFPSCPARHCMTVHSFARGKLPSQNMMNDVRLLVLGNSMRIDKWQSMQLCPPHTG